LDVVLSIGVNAANNYQSWYLATDNTFANGYIFQILNTGVITMYRLDSGTPTALGSPYTVPSFTLGTQYTVSLITNGSSISVKVAGVAQIGPVTDTTYATRKYLHGLIRGTSTTTSNRVYQLTLTSQ
jgi:hypothetical protein